MDNYTKVDVHQYVDMRIKNGTMIPKEAEKFARMYKIREKLEKRLFHGVLTL